MGNSAAARHIRDKKPVRVYTVDRYGTVTGDRGTADKFQKQGPSAEAR